LHPRFAGENLGDLVVVLDIGCGAGRSSAWLPTAARVRSGSTHPRRCSRSQAVASRRPICASARWSPFPYEDDTFGLVTGFNSFFFAADMTALREADRVAKPGAR
jgi:SAM-dependent methyltransferase